MKDSYEPSFSIEEVKEAFEGILEPEATARILTGYTERKRAEEQEAARMQRMIDIIDECDEIALLSKEGGCIITPNRLLRAANDYLALIEGGNSYAALGESAKMLALYLITVLDGPCDDDEIFSKSINDIIQNQPLVSEIKKELNEQGYALKIR